MYIKLAETERLLIKPLQRNDALDWEGFFEQNDSLQYLGLDLSLDKKTQAIKWIDSQFRRYDEDRFGHCALIDKSSQKLIGQCGLLTQEIEGEEEVEIGYHILPKYWGKGYATEAAKFFKRYAFENSICESLISVIDVRNISSQKVAEKNGMKNTKQIKCYGLDVYIYRILKEDWLINLIRSN